MFIAAKMRPFAPVLLAVDKSGEEFIGTYMTHSPDQGIFARQLRQLGDTMAWIGLPATISITALDLAGEAVHGSYAVTHFTADAPEASEVSRSFAKKYRARYNLTPDTFVTWAGDALHLPAIAFRAAASVQPEAVRSAILGIERYEGAEGRYRFDTNGDSIHGYADVKDDSAKIVFIKEVAFSPR